MQERIGEKLLRMGVISPEQLQQALVQQQETGLFLGQVLLEMFAVREDILAPVAAEQLGLPFIDLKKTNIDAAAARVYSAAKAREHRCFPYQLIDGKLDVAMVNPLDIAAVEDLGFITGCEIHQAVALEADIIAAIDQYCVDDRVENAATLINDVDRALEQSDSQCRTVSLLSNKGGTGKTHLAINLACMLSNMGNRVLLIDADLGNADISHKLNVYPEVTLLDVLDNKELPKGIIIPVEFGFDLVAGRTGESRLANLKYLQRLKFVRRFVALAEPYDFMILDLGAGVSTSVIDFGLSTDEMIIVTTPRDVISGYSCGKAAFLRHVALQRRLAEKEPDAPIESVFSPWIVINKMAYPEQGETIFERLDVTTRNHLNARIAGFDMIARHLGSVLYDADAIDAAERKRQPVSQLKPRSNAARCYEQIAARLVDPDTTSHTPVRLRGLARLTRMLGLRTEDAEHLLAMASKA